jgi:hypothetical protein
MRRRLALAVPTTTAPADDPVVSAKAAMVDALCSKLGDVNTFRSIGEIIGFGRSFVSKRLLPMFQKNPAVMYKIGDDYRIPRATAEWFIRNLYGY